MGEIFEKEKNLLRAEKGEGKWEEVTENINQPD
jgi:hypothetical protein